MASAKDTIVFPIAKKAINDTVFGKYDHQFDFMNTIDTIEYGGGVTSFIVFWAVQNDDEKSLQEIEDVFGLDWKDYFVYKYRGSKGSAASANPGTDPEKYAYFVKRSTLRTLTAGQAGVLAKHLDTSMGFDAPDCWGDMLLAIALIAVATWASGGFATGAAATLVSTTILVCAAISVSYTVQRKQMHRDLQIAMAVATMGAGLIENGVTLSLANQLISQVFQGCTVYEQEKTEKELAAIKEKTDAANEEFDAMKFRASMAFDFSDMYDQHTRQGHEKNPHFEIREQYEKFTSYPVGHDGVWVQIE